MIFLSVASVFDGFGDEDDIVITVTKAFARAILEAGFETAVWDGELTEEQSENIERSIGNVTEELV